MVKQEPQEDGQAQLPAKAPKTLSSFFCECLPRTSQGRAGKRWVGLAARSSAFPWVRRPNAPPAVFPPHARGDATWRVLGSWGLREGERVHCSPASFPSPPEASCQKRSERRRTWCSEKGGDQGVSQDPLREQQMKQRKPVSPRSHGSDCRWASKTETRNHLVSFQC